MHGGGPARIGTAMLVLALLAAAPAARAQSEQPAETLEQKAARMAWWTEARFGMFIHWGLYALAARHEWVKRNERITDEQYQKLLRSLRPRPVRPARVGEAGRRRRA